MHLQIFRLPKLGKGKIRVLIFKDCERRTSKSLLFDSDAVVNVADAVSFVFWLKSRKFLWHTDLACMYQYKVWKIWSHLCVGACQAYLQIWYLSVPPPQSLTAVFFWVVITDWTQLFTQLIFYNMFSCKSIFINSKIDFLAALQFYSPFVLISFIMSK